MSVTIENLDLIETLALHKVELAKGDRAQIMPGTYEVDLIARIRGIVTVGQDYEQRVAAAIPWKDMLLAALSQMAPVHREAFVRHYLQASQGGTPAVVNPAAIAEEVQDLAEAIIGTSVRTCSGKTTAKLAVEALEGAVKA